jgi:hypothetical protein
MVVHVCTLNTMHCVCDANSQKDEGVRRPFGSGGDSRRERTLHDLSAACAVPIKHPGWLNDKYGRIRGRTSLARKSLLDHCTLPAYAIKGWMLGSLLVTAAILALC